MLRKDILHGIKAAWATGCSNVVLAIVESALLKHAISAKRGIKPYAIALYDYT